MLLVWSTQAFLYMCNGVTNPLLWKKTVESSYRSDNNEFDIVCFAKDDGNKPIVKRIFNNGVPTLVYNMAKCSISPPMTFLAKLVQSYADQGLKQPLIISLNKPHVVPNVHGINYASYDDCALTGSILYPLSNKLSADAIKVLLCETQLPQVPDLFAEEDDNNDSLWNVLNEEPFCCYTNCKSHAMMEFNCNYCFNTFCSTECRELICGSTGACK